MKLNKTVLWEVLLAASFYLYMKNKILKTNV